MRTSPNIRKWWAVFVALCVSAAIPAGEHPKNLIVMIADGTGNQQYTFARWWKGEPMHIEKWTAGSLRTFIADSVVADSAPAATALATGVRSNDKFIGIGPTARGLLPGEGIYQGIDCHPLATVLEGARLLGKATGIVVTCRISHATPAAYFAHTHNRNLEDDITEMGVYANIDVMLGGGGRHLLPTGMKGRRTDGENLEAVLKERGYTLVKNATEMRTVTSGRLWGAFASDHMEPEMDRRETAPTQPSLAEMTAKAIELLSRNDEGFFLMVEGSQIDWANHANDPAYAVTDLMAWDDACGTALDFAHKDGNTLVVMLSDHDTGGFTIGNYRTNTSYSQMKLPELLDPIRKVTMSSTRMASMLGKSPSLGDAKDIVRKGWGVELADSDARRLLELAAYYGADRNWAFGEVLSAAHTSIGWSTHGHTGGDVPVGAFGPGKPVGVYDEPGIGAFCADILGLNMENLTRRLFVDASQAFAGGTVGIVPVTVSGDGGSQAVDHSLLVEYNGKKAEFRANKNVVTVDDRAIEMEGVAYYNQGNGIFYVPAQAVALLTGVSQSLPPIRKRTN